MRWYTAWNLLKQTGQTFIIHKATRLGAALAFYITLSLAPLLLLVIGIAGLVYGEQAARGEIARQLNDLIGGEAAVAVQSMLARSASPTGGTVAMIVGVVLLLVGATGIFTSLQDALDTVWDVNPDRSSGGFWGLIRDRLLSILAVCAVAILLLFSLVFSAIVSGLGEAFERWFPNSSVWLGAANVVLEFLLTTALFAMVYKLLPHVRLVWSDVYAGAVLTAALFILGKYPIGLYLGRTAVGSTFGAAGSFVVLLLWVYYSSLIFLFGAEFTQVYAARHGTWAGKAPAKSPAVTLNTNSASVAPV